MPGGNASRHWRRVPGLTWSAMVRTLILEHRAVDEVRPDIEDVDQLVGEAREAPGLVGMHDERAVVAQEPVIEIDHALG